MTLYVAATPIGNLDDVTRRLRDTLEGVDLVYCEDTRHSRKLLAALDVHAELRAYHDHSSDEARAAIVRELTAGRRLALISDAGTPCISDPGYRLVRDARAAGVTVVPIPGPSALVTFLSVSGLPTDRFQFVGFAPRKANARRQAVSAWLSWPGTTVAYESPHRLVELLQDLAAAAPERELCVGRELTKRYETLVFGTAAEVLAQMSSEPVRGEVVVGVTGASAEPASTDDREVDAWVAALAPTSIGTKDAARVLADRLGIARDDAYQRILEARSTS